jgi:hypothetical protein
VIRDFLAERQLSTGAIGERGVDLRAAFGDTLARALGEFDDEVVEFALAVNDVGDDLLVARMVDEDR